ncbi:MAG: cellulose biosynthesis cyclic di-GMP-binding regulatory protein BcsB, partial [Candidatus Atribacteria bacterium]|nr:cellulose biosynthesis cyclic di-GMP-binding regulatory protein BcsB [Candidatus Atribacteria bacterium]
RSGKIESQGSIPVSPRQKVTLSQLGVPSVHVQGIGDMKNTFFFSASELGGYPHQISFTLLENHTSMTQGSLTEAFLKVFFNQELVAVKKLEKDQVSEMTPYAFSIPSSLIRRDNEVQFIYSYYPEVSNCRQGTAPLEGFISGDSYIETWGKRKNPSLLTWHDVPIFFRGNGRIVFPSHPNRELLELSARLYASLREMDSDPFSFDLEVSIENPQNRPTPDQLPLTSPGTPFFPGRSMEVWHQLVQIPNDLQAYASSPELQNMNFLGKLLNIVGRTLIQYGEVTFQFLNLFFAFPQPTGSPIEKALPSPADYLLVIQPGNIPSTLRSPVIPTSGETILYHLANQRPVLKYSMDEPVGFLSVFWDKNQPVILYTTTGSDSVANENTRNFFLGASTIRSLNGNVTFFGRNGISDLTVGEDLQWNQTPTSSGTIFFENYKLFIYLGIFALIVVVCIYLAFKLSKPSLKNGR